MIPIIDKERIQQEEEYIIDLNINDNEQTRLNIAKKLTEKKRMDELIANGSYESSSSIANDLDEYQLNRSLSPVDDNNLVIDQTDKFKTIKLNKAKYANGAHAQVQSIFEAHVDRNGHSSFASEAFIHVNGHSNGNYNDLINNLIDDEVNSYALDSGKDSNQFSDLHKYVQNDELLMSSYENNLNGLESESNNTIGSLSLTISNENNKASRIMRNGNESSSLSNIGNNSNSSVFDTDKLLDIIHSPQEKQLQQLQQQNGSDKQTTSLPKSILMKDLNKEERIRMLTEKREQELAKRKKEIEENLKRKEELRDKQLKERQKRIDELKNKETEKRAAAEERRKLREESARMRINELVKKEQEREKQSRLSTKLNNTNKGSEWVLSAPNESNNASSFAASSITASYHPLNDPTPNSSSPISSSTMNKSQSAYNLNSNHSKKKETGSSLLMSTSVDTTGVGKRANSALRLTTPSVNITAGTTSPSSVNNKQDALNTINESGNKRNEQTEIDSISRTGEEEETEAVRQAMINSNTSSATPAPTSKRRSRTVPTTPKHNNNNNNNNNNRSTQRHHHHHHHQNNNTNNNNITQINMSPVSNTTSSEANSASHIHKALSRMIERNTSMSAKRSKAPNHSNAASTPINTNTNNTTITITSTNNNNNNTSTNSTSNISRSLYWEGPPAHFMLPTHAIHCRSSRSIERCPRACKALTDMSDTAQHSATNQSHKPLSTIVERKPLAAHLQQFVNRLSMPKKASEEQPPANLNSVSNVLTTNINTNVNNIRASTPQSIVNEGNEHTSIASASVSLNANSGNNTLTLKKSAQSNTLKKPLKAFAVNSDTDASVSTKQTIKKSLSKNTISETVQKRSQPTTTTQTAATAAKSDAKKKSTSNGNIVGGAVNTNLTNSKKSSSNTAIVKTSTVSPTPKGLNTNAENENQLKNDEQSNQANKEEDIGAKKSAEIGTNDAESSTSCVAEVSAIETTETRNETESKLEEEQDFSSNSVSVSQQKEVVSVPLAAAPPVAVSSARVMTTEEEEYKKKLEEKRREAREKAAREAELERQRQEQIRLEEEEKQRQQEELERLAEEEELRLNKLAREQEEERLRLAIEQNEKMESERRLKEENEKKIKEENERKAKEESERQERERLEKAKKEEEERLERKKKLDMIMRRVHKEDSSQSNLNNMSNANGLANSNSNLLMTASNSDLASASLTSSFVSTNGTSNSTTNGINTNNPLTGISMTTSMINTSSASDQNSADVQRFKTPLLQSILSKSRITTILNKYADDPILSSSTLSLLAQNNQTNTNNTNNPLNNNEEDGTNEVNNLVNGEGSEDNEELKVSDEIVDQTENEFINFKSKEVDFKLEGESVDDEEEEAKVHEENINNNTKLPFDLQLGDVHVVVDTSSASSSPSSPTSSTSSTSSHPSSPPAPAPPASQTQISA